MSDPRPDNGGDEVVKVERPQTLKEIKDEEALTKLAERAVVNAKRIRRNPSQA